MAVCFTAFTLIITSRAEAQNNTNGELSVLYWKPTPELVISTPAVTGAGIDEVDFVKEFGIEDKWFPEFRGSLGRKHKLRFGYVPIKYEASARITRTITLKGTTFTVGAPANTEIKWDLWRVGYEWDVVSTNSGFFGLIAELKYNKVTATIDSPALARASTTEQKAPVPTIGAIGRGYLAPHFAVSAEFTALKIDRSEINAKFYDFDVNAFATFGKYIGAQGGYRSVTVDYVVDDDTGDLKMKGPYAGLILRF
jgi:hypothetical protein